MRNDINSKIKNKAFWRRVALVLVDCLFLYGLAFFTRWLVCGSVREFSVAYLTGLIAFQILLLSAFAIYRIRIEDSSLELVLKIGSSLAIVIIGAGLIVGVRNGFSSQSFRWLLVYNVFAFIGILGIRLMYRLRKFFLSNQKTNDLPKALIYGAGETGSTMVRMQHRGKFEYQIVGFIDDNPKYSSNLIQGVNVLGTIDDLADILKTTDVEALIIAITNISSEKIQKTVEIAKHFKVSVKIVPSLFETKSGKEVSVRDIDYSDLLGRSLITIEKEPMLELFAGKTILVTGAGGSIGSEICRQLMFFSPKKLLLLDIDETELHDLCERLLNFEKEWNDQVVPVVCDVKNEAKVRQIFELYKPDIVLHAAAYKHVPLMELYPEEAILNNICGSYYVFRAARDNKAEKVIVISTDKAVNPTNIMGATKRVVEMVASALNTKETPICCVRFGNVIGSRGSMLPLFLEQIKAGKDLTVTDRNIIRYFMAIPEAVGLVFRAATIANGGEVMVLDMGEPVKIYDFAQKLIDVFGDGRSQIKITGLRPGEKLYEELLANKDNTIPTENQKIFKAKVVNNPKYTEEYLKNTIHLLPTKGREELVARLHEAVPEFQNGKKK